MLMNFRTFLMSLRAKRSNPLLKGGLLRRSPSLRSGSLLAMTLIAMTMLMSCSTLDEWLTTPTPIIPTETPPPTATINWFPPSATPTFQTFSTKAPTPELRPGLGEFLIEDDFATPTLWTLAASNQGSASIENNHLTIAVQSGVFLLSLRNDLILANYYAEITARPSLCRGDDNYGVLVRANASSYYRIALACNGTIRAERLTNGARIILQTPLPSADVPPGAPGEVRIGVWAVGREMRIFLNERYQFTISDPSFPSGSIGVFVRSAGSTAAVVSFSDLGIRSVEYTLPTITPPP